METMTNITKRPDLGFLLEATTKITVPPAFKLIRRVGFLKAVLVPGTDLMGMSYPDIQRLGENIGEGGSPMSRAYIAAQEKSFWDYPRPNWLALLYVEVDEKYWLEQASYPLVEEVLSVAALDPATIVTAHTDGAYHPDYWKGYGFQRSDAYPDVFLHYGGLQWPTGSWAHQRAEDR